MNDAPARFCRHPGRDLAVCGSSGEIELCRFRLTIDELIG